MVLENRVVCRGQLNGNVWQCMAMLVEKVARLPMFANVLWRGNVNVGRDDAYGKVQENRGKTRRENV